jgi:hypothetical protein
LQGGFSCAKKREANLASNESRMACTFRFIPIQSHLHSWVLQMSLTSWVEFELKSYAQILHKCIIISSVWAKPKKLLYPLLVVIFKLNSITKNWSPTRLEFVASNICKNLRHGLTTFGDGDHSLPNTKTLIRNL